MVRRRIRFLFSIVIGLAIAIFTVAKSPVVAQPSPPTNYTQLQTLLTAKNWQAADTETRRILEQIVYPDKDFYDANRIKTFPCDVLRRLDNLWVQASNGRFGFSVQKRLWYSLVNLRIRDKRLLVERFGSRVGWRRLIPQPENEFPKLPWLTDKELNFTLNAPIGHLPWSGVNSSLITSLYQESGPGCGSCTIDAMYLSDERNYTYLPALFERVDRCQRNR